MHAGRLGEEESTSLRVFEMQQGRTSCKDGKETGVDTKRGRERPLHSLWPPKCPTVFCTDRIRLSNEANSPQ